MLRSRYACNIILVECPEESAHVDKVYGFLEDKISVYNRAGEPSIGELAAVLQHADMMLSTGSGTEHLYNIMGAKLVVTFGAGSE